MHRVSSLNNHFEPALLAGQTPTPTPAAASVGVKKDSLSVVDNRTGI